MSLLHILLLAVIQGVTEFLPISSSGHLILLPYLTGTPDQGLTIDVAVHLGTLGAVILFFRRDVGQAAGGLGRLVRGKADTPGARLALLLIVATIPVMIVGYSIHRAGLDQAMRSVAVIGWAMLIFGIVLWWADRRGSTGAHAEDWTLRHAWIMGLWQCLALIPGTSRSGITITAALKLGYRREDAARLSMLMSIPTIIASAGLLGLELVRNHDTARLHEGAIAAVFAFASALLALWLMMKLLRTVSFAPYVAYRVVLGIGLLYWAYS